MAKSFEWLVIRVETLYKILVVVVIAAALGIGWWLLHRSDPKIALNKAQQRYSEVSARVAKVKDDCDPSLKPKMSEAFDSLARANDALKSGEVEIALAESGKAMAIADRMADECSGPNRATIVAVSGAAEVKKADRPDYEPLKRNMRVDPGDVIRTGSGAQVVVKFPDETLQSISADTLFQIRSFERMASGGFSVNGLLSEGSTDINRPANSPADTRIQIATPQDVQTSLTPGSRVAVAGGAAGTQVAVVQGSVTVEHAGQTTSVSQGNKVSATDSAAPLVSAKIPRPPTQLSPADQQVVNAETGEKPELLFTWTASEGVRNYRLQLGRDPFMSESLMADAPIQNATQMRIKLPSGAGNYYWRVRADESSPAATATASTPASAAAPVPIAIENTLWSFVYGFRVMERQTPNPAACSGGATGPGCTPLEVKCQLNPLSWDTVIVTCNTTPGLSLTIDSIGCELVDGRCRKIKTFSSAGNQQILVKVFDNYGNEKTQTLVYKVIPQ